MTNIESYPYSNTERITLNICTTAWLLVFDEEIDFFCKDFGMYFIISPPCRHNLFHTQTVEIWFGRQVIMMDNGYDLEIWVSFVGRWHNYSYFSYISSVIPWWIKYRDNILVLRNKYCTVYHVFTGSILSIMVGFITIIE